MSNSRVLKFIAGATVAVLACVAVAQQTGVEHNKKWNQFVSQFVETYFRMNPTAAVDAGRHEYDGQLPDWSEPAISKNIQWLHEQQKQAAAFDENTLSERERFERDYLISETNAQLFWLETARVHRKNPMFYSGAVSPSVYVTRPYASLEQRMRAYIKYANNIPKATEQIRANLRTPLPKTYVEVGSRVFGELAPYYRNDVTKIFEPVKNTDLQAQFREANEKAYASMEQLGKWLEQQMPSATDDFAMGRELFSEMLRATEHVEIPIDRLEEIGRKDLERNLAMLKEACAKFAPGQTEKQCVAKMQANKPEGGPVAAAQKQLTFLKKFVIDKGVVTVPGPEEAKVAEAPPYRRFNAAYIEIPGAFEKNLPSVYYIAPPDPQWTKEEQEAYVPPDAELLAISVHEVWPGHFLQYLHANRSPFKFGQIFVGYAFAEGWAHYTEEMMWQMGLGNGDPEIHIGQIIHALLRDVRYLSAIGLHTRGMTVAESEKMFQEKAFKDVGNARQQARRGTFDPAYLNYTMGKLMILKLRDDWCATRGGKKAWREFHDKFLSYGGPPIPFVRKQMLGKDSKDLF